MRYSDETIEEVRMQNDIVSVISGYVKLTKKGSSHFGLCPFHNEKSPSFSVSQSKQMYYCFGCGTGGNVFTFIMEYENYTFVEAVKMLADRAGMKLPALDYSREEKEKADRKMAILELNKLAANYFYRQLQSENGTKAKKYFQERQLSEKTMKHFGLGYSNIYRDDLFRYLRSKGYGDGEESNQLLLESGLVRYDEKFGMQDKFWNRVMFPIMDVNNRVIGFGGRVMGDGQPKYMNSSETLVFDKSRNLYGLNFARTTRESYMFVCEGYMDVIAMHQAGFTNAVASLGTAFTQGHGRLLKRYTQEVILLYDSDGAGTAAALRAIPILRDAGIRIRVFDMSPYKDPDEFLKNLGPEKFKERIGQAKNSFMFEIDVLQREYRMDDPDSLNSFYRAVAARLLEFREELERETYLKTIADKYQIDAGQLRSLVTSVSLTMSGETISPKPKSGIAKKEEKEDGVLRSQRLLLTWMIDNPGLYDKINVYVKPEDFTEPFYQTIARMLFEQCRDGNINPAGIISCFTEEEQQKKVAAMFNTDLEDINTKEEKEKALSETVYKIKENSVKYYSEHLEPTDIEGLQKIVNDKKDLQNMRGLHIFLD